MLRPCLLGGWQEGWGWTGCCALHPQAKVHPTGASRGRRCPPTPRATPVFRAPVYWARCQWQGLVQSVHGGDLTDHQSPCLVTRSSGWGTSGSEHQPPSQPLGSPGPLWGEQGPEAIGAETSLPVWAIGGCSVTSDVVRAELDLARSRGLGGGPVGATPRSHNPLYHDEGPWSPRENSTHSRCLDRQPSP